MNTQLENKKMKIIANNLFKDLEGTLLREDETRVELEMKREDGTTYIYVGNIADLEEI